jgi:CDP-glucose 4,6-dehydratase
LSPESSPNFFEVASVNNYLENSHIADIRDLDKLKAALVLAQPDIVFHMAAQPLVRRSYRDPIGTFSTNVMGSANLLEAIRQIPSVQAVLMITTDKCYENKEWDWGYREIDQLGGYDPYSSSKACSELITNAFRNSFFDPKRSLNSSVAIASARAGNVIGGGDWSEDRIVPDIVRAIAQKKSLKIRNPAAIRPWQHVLEPLSGYMLLAQAMFKEKEIYSSAWNFGPNEDDIRAVVDVVEMVRFRWGKSLEIEVTPCDDLQEAKLLRLDCSKAKEYLNWRPRWDFRQSVNQTVDWYKAFLSGEAMSEFTITQIRQFRNG